MHGWLRVGALALAPSAVYVPLWFLRQGVGPDFPLAGAWDVVMSSDVAAVPLVLLLLGLPLMATAAGATLLRHGRRVAGGLLVILGIIAPLVNLMTRAS